MSIKLKTIFASNPRTKRATPVQLGGDPKGENFLYTCGNSVVIRNIKNPAIAELYNEHPAPTTVAKYSPSRFYIASGDEHGNVRIWDTTQAEHILKFQCKPIAGPISDIAWSPDSQRIIAVGEGREKYGHVFMWDSGTSVGEIIGHTKQITSVDFKPTRPYRIVTSSIDQTVVQYEGPPFKYKLTIKDHSKFVNCVRYSPSGDHFVSVGSDMKGYLYDAKTGDKVSELSSENAHTGGIYGVCWSPDNTRVLTASADKTSKLWDVQTGRVISTFTYAENATLDHQQLGCMWQGENILTVGLNGEIAYLDLQNPSKPLRVLKGHNKFVGAVAYNSSKRTIYSGSYDGIVHRWNYDDGPTDGVSGAGHTNEVKSIAIDGINDKVYTAGLDDTVRVIDLNTNTYTADKVATEGPVSGLAIAPSGNPGVVVASTINSLRVLRAAKQVSVLPVSYKPNGVAISPDGLEVVVAGDDNKVYIYSLESDVLKPAGTFERHRGAVMCIAYSPDGTLIASGDANREVVVWERQSRAVKCEGWVFHTARVSAIAWSPDSQLVATGSLDQSIIVWNVAKPTERRQFKGAHQGGVNSVAFADNLSLVSSGQDSCVKSWTISA
eukprot:TRINITY_DN17282_c0_g1_i1.p1 TRINITY_DN17282_c0_g1~~TRINITY_DN17282_c0_g1_i1.p1  ORF type:complete len:608 (+),score=126.31 TRINITY_DN17282_c0_g1_i1:71-1894(+)